MDEVQRLRSSITFLLYRDRPPQIDLRVRSDARWLIQEIHRRKPESSPNQDGGPCVGSKLEESSISMRVVEAGEGHFSVISHLVEAEDLT